jgi:hypothetical protein
MVGWMDGLLTVWSAARSMRRLCGHMGGEVNDKRDSAISNTQRRLGGAIELLLGTPTDNKMLHLDCRAVFQDVLASAGICRICNYIAARARMR